MRLPTASRPVSAETSSSNSLARPPSLTLNQGPTTLSLMVSGLPHPSVLLPCSSCAVPVRDWGPYMQYFHFLLAWVIYNFHLHDGPLHQELCFESCCSKLKVWQLLHSDKRLHLGCTALGFCSLQSSGNSSETQWANLTTLIRLCSHLNAIWHAGAWLSHWFFFSLP